MTAYVSECFTMNEFNRLKLLQDVIDGSFACHRISLPEARQR